MEQDQKVQRQIKHKDSENEKEKTSNFETEIKNLINLIRLYYFFILISINLNQDNHLSFQLLHLIPLRRVYSNL